MPVTTKLDWRLLKYKMAKYIDVDALNWYDDLFIKGENHSGVLVRYRDVEHFIKNAPPADVVTMQEVDDAVDDALHVLDSFNSSGKLDYNVYSELHDMISNIYCSLKESQSG